MPVLQQHSRRSARANRLDITAPRSSWLPEPAAPGVALVTTSDYLHEEIARIGTAAAVPIHTVSSARELAPAELQSGTVLVGSDIGELPGVRASIVLVGLAGEGDGLWELAADLGAERVAVLPEAAGWLAEYLNQLSNAGASGHMIGVVGASGGAGASTLSIWLAQAAATGTPTLLVDVDPWGGGLDAALGLEQKAGIRWQDLAAARGSINPMQLQNSLPAVGGFSLLSFGAGGSSAGEHDEAGQATRISTGGPEGGAPETSHEVLIAAGRGYGLTILDLGRNAASLDTAVRYCQRLIVVVPARIRAAAAGRLLIQRAGQLPVSVVVRGPLLAGSDAHLVAESVGFELGAYWKPMRGLRAAAEAGRILDYGTGRAARRLSGAVLGELPAELWQVPR